MQPTNRGVFIDSGRDGRDTGLVQIKPMTSAELRQRLSEIEVLAKSLARIEELLIELREQSQVLAQRLDAQDHRLNTVMSALGKLAPSEVWIPRQKAYGLLGITRITWFRWVQKGLVEEGVHYRNKSPSSSPRWVVNVSEVQSLRSLGKLS